MTRVIFIFVTLAFVTLACGRLVSVSPVDSSQVVVTDTVTDAVTVAPSVTAGQITVVPVKGVWRRVCNCEYLNVRDGVGGVVIGSISQGDIVYVYEVSMGWSMIKEGWVRSIYLCKADYILGE